MDWPFASLFFISLCQCLAILDSGPTNQSLGLNASGLRSLPAVPYDFRVMPSTIGTPIQANAMEVTHLIVLVFLAIWNYNGPSRYIRKDGEDFLDPDYSRNLHLLIFPASFTIYGKIESAVWTGVRILETQIDAMGNDDINFNLPARGYRVMVGSDAIGITSIRDATPDSNATDFNDPGYNATVSTEVIASPESTNLTIPQDTIYDVRVVLIPPGTISRKDVLQLLLLYLATLFRYNGDETVAQYYSQGFSYQSEPREGLQLEVTYLLLRRPQRGTQVKWIDIIQGARFVLQALASDSVFMAFIGRVSFFDSRENPFVQYKVARTPATSDSVYKS